MAIEQADNIQTGAPKPTDSRYYNNLIPYSSCNEVNSTVGLGVRYSGLTVNILGTEYWYKDGITNPDLVEKTSAGGSITGGTNGLGYIGKNVCLGGSLSTNTTISGTSKNLTIGTIASKINLFSVYSDSICLSYPNSNDGGKLFIDYCDTVIGNSYYNNASDFQCAKICFNHSDADGIRVDIDGNSSSAYMAYCQDHSSAGGSNPRWIPDAGWVTGQTGGGGIDMSGSTANGITTYVDADTICAEPNLTFDGSTLQFEQGATRTISIAQATDGGVGDGLNICAGAGDDDTSPQSGGILRLEGGIGGADTDTGTGGVGGAGILCGGTGGAGNFSANGGIGGAAYVRGGTGGDGDTDGCGGHVYVCGGFSADNCGGDVYVCGGSGQTGGCVAIYHDATKRLHSTTTGVEITGVLCQSNNIYFCEGGNRCICIPTATDGGHGNCFYLIAGAATSDTVPGQGGGAMLRGGEGGTSTDTGNGGLGGWSMLYGGTGGAGGGAGTDGGEGGSIYLRGGVGGAGSDQCGIGGDVYICGGDGNDNLGGCVLICSGAGSVDGCIMLYHDTSQKLRTTTTGTYTTGTHCATTCVRTPLICVTGSGNVHLAMSLACGSAIDWIATSDCRVKKCVEPITSALSTVDALCGVCYELCEDDTKDMGLIAQDVEKIEPRLVAHGDVPEEYKKYGIEDEMLGLKYDKFAGLFVEAIKELKQQNECLQKQINEIKKNN